MSKFTPFGIEIRKYRLDNSLRLGDMANEIGVTSAYLSAVEMGKRKLTDHLLEKIISIIKTDKVSKMQLAELGREFRGQNL